jgi:hypothetical protein
MRSSQFGAEDESLALGTAAFLIPLPSRLPVNFPLLGIAWAR